MGTIRGVHRLRAFAPVLAIAAVQLALYPLPLGVWVRGVIVGGLTALIALGMALTYQSNRVVSFAQADLGMAPVVLVYLLFTAWGWPWAIAVPVGLVTAAGLGAVVELAVIRRFRTAPRLLLTVATIGLAQVLGGLALLLPRWFDVQLLAPRIEPPFGGTFELGGTIFGPNDLLAVLAVPAAVGILAALLRRSHLGLAARAVADRADRAAMLGVSVGRVQTAVWAATGVLAFVAVFLRAGVLGLPVGSALSLGILLRALAALLIGRFTNLPVVAAAAVALGVLEVGVAWHASSTAAVDPVLAAVVIGALLLRRRAPERAGGEVSSWQAADDARPVPDAVNRLGPVRAVRWGGGAAVLAATATLPVLLPVDQSLKVSAVLIYAILGLSVVVLTGWTGLVSLGQVALFAIGAAVGAVATGRWGLDMSVGLLASAIAAAAAAVVIGFPALRLRGVELGVVTLAAALATTSWLLNPRFFDWVPTRRVERPALLGGIDLDSPMRMHLLALGALVLCLVGLRGIRASRTGRALLAVRDNERAAQAYGISAVRLRLTAFALSGGLAGLAGGLFVHHQQAFGEQPYLPAESFLVFTMVVLGGVATPLGAVLGAVWMHGARWFLPEELQLLASGAGVLLILLELPGGIGGAVLQLRDRWYARIANRRRTVVAGGVTEPGSPGSAAAIAVAVATSSGPDALSGGSAAPAGAEVAVTT